MAPLILKKRVEEKDVGHIFLFLKISLLFPIFHLADDTWWKEEKFISLKLVLTNPDNFISTLASWLY